MTTGEPVRRGAGSAQQTVRRHNLALVLREIAEGEPVSRAGVAQRTGLTRGTVSSLVEELIADGLVTELAVARGTTGRPASPLQLNRSGPAGLGIEIGVDEVGVCVVDLSGTVRAQRSAASDHRTREPAVGLDRAAALAAEVVAEAGLPVEGAGVALPGVVGRDGVLQRAPNLPRWVDVAVDAELAARLGLPVDVGNEADLAAAAELWFDGGPPDFVHVSGGIGVGAGIVLGGELFRGPGGRAGELGHVVVDPDGPACSCGGRGCLEQLAGQRALLELTGARDVEALLRDPGRATAVAGRALGVALAGVVNLVDVPTVVLGGLYARLGEPLAAAVTAELRSRVPSRPEVTVRLSEPDAGGALRAAAALVVRRRLRRP
ncbi:ROK family transcriptional regulator [Pseudonocardia humida]|uniref:ROK family transcriptional regulator n=1 Tax=Pseudonocardia humida TaxID=2800819 RepID=A0ABT1ACK7_9PSEU|nr:ROK family transcriptional regulator [Pseudonocardia humida]MCO1660733.1 ROK family transcriptional regulator [Pseudonocardia humida]